jgi:hypothetical protein
MTSFGLGIILVALETQCTFTLVSSLRDVTHDMINMINDIVVHKAGRNEYTACAMKRTPIMQRNQTKVVTFQSVVCRACMQTDTYPTTNIKEMLRFFCSNQTSKKRQLVSV